MANSKITWNDKVSLVTDPTIAEINKVTDDNMNEIKSVVNENADQVILSDTEPTSNDNEIWIEPNGTLPYVNSEVNIGATNVNNTPTWFVTSKNIYDTSEDLYGYIINTSNQIIATAGYRTSKLLKVKPNTKYTLTRKVATGSGVENLMRIGYCSADGTIFDRPYSENNPWTFTTPSNCEYIRVSYQYTTGGTISNMANYDVQVEEGETATTYSPYKVSTKIYNSERNVETDTGWQIIELKNGTTARSAAFSFLPQVRVIGNQAYIKGSIVLPNISTTTIVATLPDNSKPAYEIAFPSITDIVIWGDPNGNIYVQSNSSQAYRKINTEYLIN